MVKNNEDRLSYHERVRYDYLFKNFHYLNKREQVEFQYLKNKKNGPQVRSDARDSKTADTGLNHKSKVYKNKNSLSVSKRKTTQKSKRQQSRSKRPFKKIIKVFMWLLILVFVGMLIMFVKGMTSIPSAGKTAVKEVFHGEKTTDGTNILILGSDKRVSDTSEDARTDTIMVVNIGNKDKKIKMVSFMRDTLVNIPGVSATSDSYDHKLNAAFSIGEQNNHQGAELMRETLKTNFDINIQYYMMVDFQTFAEAINTLFPKGVMMDAAFGTINGEKVDSVQVPDDLRMDSHGNVPQQTIKIGKQRMDGRTLLNYARFRKDDDGDFGRTKRQQQVLSAILKQSKNPLRLFTGSEALGKTYSLISTNVSYSYLLKSGLSSIFSGRFHINQTTIPKKGDWIDTYDIYAGQALSIDFEKYQNELTRLGFR